MRDNQKSLRFGCMPTLIEDYLFLRDENDNKDENMEQDEDIEKDKDKEQDEN